MVVLPKNGYAFMVRRMKASIISTVNEVMPWEWLHTIPLRIRPLRSSPVRSTFQTMTLAMATEQCRPGPSFVVIRHANPFRLWLKGKTVIQARGADLAVQIDALGCSGAIAADLLSRYEIPHVWDASLRRILIGAP